MFIPLLIKQGQNLSLLDINQLEYNIEKSIGELVEFGSSHEITLAYRFIAKKEYKYNGDNKVSGLFTKKRNAVAELPDEELEGILMEMESVQKNQEQRIMKPRYY